MRFRLNSRILLAFAFCSALLPQALFAHPIEYGAMSTYMRADGSRIEFRSEAPANAVGLALTSAYPGDKLDFYGKYFAKRFVVTQAGIPCRLALDSYEIGSDTAVFNGRFECAAQVQGLEGLSIASTLFDAELERFDHFLSLTAGGARWEILFDREHGEFPASAAAKESSRLGYASAVAAKFLKLGAIHIVEGYDHVLFLLSLVLLVRSRRRILLLATAFTAAHSVTLALSTLDVISLSPRIVEPLIALSIAYASVRNIIALDRGAASEGSREGAVATFAFGLMHGLGFAGVLAETRIPHDFFAPSLLFFNIGIEIGQLAILAAAVPILAFIDRRCPSRAPLRYAAYAMLAASLLIFLSRL